MATQALQHPWCKDAMEGDELTDLSLTRAKLRKKDDHHRFKASRAPVMIPSCPTGLLPTSFGPARSDLYVC